MSTRRAPLTRKEKSHVPWAILAIALLCVLGFMVEATFHVLVPPAPDEGRHPIIEDLPPSSLVTVPPVTMPTL